VADALWAVGVESDVRVVVGKQLPAEALAAAACGKLMSWLQAVATGTFEHRGQRVGWKTVTAGEYCLWGHPQSFCQGPGEFRLMSQALPRVIAANHVESVDVGEVNGRLFINNSSLGIYPAGGARTRDISQPATD